MARGNMRAIKARYRHPQGSTIVVYDDDSLLKFTKEGKYTSTSATAEKLEAGHGRWRRLTGADGLLYGDQLVISGACLHER